MFEDEGLKLRFKAGRPDALQRIYEKYRDRLLTLAMALLSDDYAAEDVLHDVFVAFAQSANGFRLRGNLKAYLATCVANRARDRLRARRRRPESLDTDMPIESDFNGPEGRIIADEASKLVSTAMVELPYKQREVVALHLNGGMTFRQIAKHQGVSISTAKGRYRYGLQKLRSILNGRL
jgi:RNA polymerase sigma-70 factor (ECF subfamily)